MDTSCITLRTEEEHVHTPGLFITCFPVKRKFYRVVKINTEKKRMTGTHIPRNLFGKRVQKMKTSVKIHTGPSVLGVESVERDSSQHRYLATVFI